MSTTAVMHTHITSQREAIANCHVGTELRVRYVGGSSTCYMVTAINGDKARELELVGKRGAKRWLVDGGDRLWLKDPTAAKRKGRNESGGHRRVISIQVLISPEFRQLEELERKAADAEAWRARLPAYYTVGVTDSGFVAVSNDCAVAGRLNALPEEVGGPHSNAWEAVCDAWEDAVHGLEDEVDRRDRELEERRKQTASLEAERDMRREDAARCRLALQQLLELARGLAPTGYMLPSSTSPDAVVAAVGHALRVESMKDTRPLL